MKNSSRKIKTGLEDKVTSWLAYPIPRNVADRIERLAASKNIAQIAVMPDVHLAKEYCVGTVVASATHVIPLAVGGDIGCGMTAVRINLAADQIVREQLARKLLALLNHFVPTNKHSRQTVASRLPKPLYERNLSHLRLDKMASRDGRVQLGTLGRGNHFLEFQAAEDGGLWLLIHSGSRAMGQAITAHHLGKTVRQDDVGGLAAFEVNSDAGRAYLHDVAWASLYAQHNRMAMLRMTAEILHSLWNAEIDDETLIESDHNHLRLEQHFGEKLWIHRKGAQSASAGEPGVVPGSMGTASYHVLGRGCDSALQSCSHGAGRNKSRTKARAEVTLKSLDRQLGGVIFDRHKAVSLRDEAPSAYKDIRKVMKAQKELVKITRVLRPLVSYKGT